MFKNGMFVMFIAVGGVAVVGGAGIGGAWDAGSGIGLLLVMAGVGGWMFDALRRNAAADGTTMSPTDDRNRSSDQGSSAASPGAPARR